MTSSSPSSSSTTPTPTPTPTPAPAPVHPPAAVVVPERRSSVFRRGGAQNGSTDDGNKDGDVSAEDGGEQRALAEGPSTLPARTEKGSEAIAQAPPQAPVEAALQATTTKTTNASRKGSSSWTRSEWWPGPFCRRQMIYLLVMQTFAPMLLDGAANFGVAVALYRQRNVVKLWPFPDQTVAGDMGVTVIIQGVATFLIVSSLVHHDLRHNSGMHKPGHDSHPPIPALTHVWPPLQHLPSKPFLDADEEADMLGQGDEEKGGQRGTGRRKRVGGGILRRWARQASHLCRWAARKWLMGSEENDLFDSGLGFKVRARRLIWSALQGLGISCLFFFLIWPIGIAIVAPIYRNHNLAGTWVPMIIKLIYGAVYGVIINPFVTLLAMGSPYAVARTREQLPLWRGETDEDRHLGEEAENAGQADDTPQHHPDAAPDMSTAGGAPTSSRATPPSAEANAADMSTVRRKDHAVETNRANRGSTLSTRPILSLSARPSTDGQSDLPSPSPASAGGGTRSPLQSHQRWSTLSEDPIGPVITEATIEEGLEAETPTPTETAPAMEADVAPETDTEAETVESHGRNDGFVDALEEQR